MAVPGGGSGSTDSQVQIEDSLNSFAEAMRESDGDQLLGLITDPIILDEEPLTPELFLEEFAVHLTSAADIIDFELGLIYYNQPYRGAY